MLVHTSHILLYKHQKSKVGKKYFEETWCIQYNQIGSIENLLKYLSMIVFKMGKCYLLYSKKEFLYRNTNIQIP